MNKKRRTQKVLRFIYYVRVYLSLTVYSLYKLVSHNKIHMLGSIKFSFVMEKI